MTIFKRSFNKHFAVLAIFTGISFSCGSDSDTESDALLNDTDTIKSAVLNVAGELFSVPSPIQTALLIQKSGITYDKSVLNDTHKMNTFSTDFSQALNLGIFGADLGYVSLYNQTQDALSFLAAIKQLSDKLGLSAAFDPATMERISNNITNKDSMMVLVGIAYRASDAYLKNNQRTDISSLILAGGWIESMHFSIHAYKSKPNDQIRYRIAEQKQALNSIVKILRSNSSPEIQALAEALGKISKEYEAIEFKYSFVEPTTDTIKKITYINSVSEVLVTDEQLASISNKIVELRNKIVNSTPLNN